MTTMLDATTTYSKIDPEDIRHGIEHLAEQVRLAWSETRKFNAPASYKNVDHVVMVGMGGSALGPEMLMTAFASRLTLPVTLVRDYRLPTWVNSKTLVVLSSFSGTTEEVLSAAEEAKKKKAKTMVVAAGGPLVDMAKRARWPLYVFTPGELAKEPRLGTAFALVGIAGMLSSLGILKFNDHDVRRMVSAMGEVLDTCAIDVPEKENPAKAVAHALVGRYVCIVGAEHLVGNTRVFNNQVNESGKQFAFWLTLPELNHHFLEGLTFPKGFTKNFSVVMLRSGLYHPRTQKRFDVTAQMLEKLGVEVIDYVPNGKDTIEECGEVLQFSGFVTYYLAILNKINPRTTHYVYEFKRLMSE